MNKRAIDADRVEKKRWRQSALRGLARGFSYPDPGWMENLVSGEWADVFHEVLEPLGASAEGLRKAVAALPGEPGEALRAMQTEYTRLFINALPHVPAPPYASAYSAQGMLMGEPAEAALRAYRKAGLDLAETFGDLPDHIAAELEFLALLEERAAEAQEKGEKEQAQEWEEEKEAFLSRQLIPWLPEFGRRVEETARLAFYPELVKLAGAVLKLTP